MIIEGLPQRPGHDVASTLSYSAPYPDRWGWGPLCLAIGSPQTREHIASGTHDAPYSIVNTVLKAEGYRTDVACNGVAGLDRFYMGLPETS